MVCHLMQADEMFQLRLRGEKKHHVENYTKYQLSLLSKGGGCAPLVGIRSGREGMLPDFITTTKFICFVYFMVKFKDS